MNKTELAKAIAANVKSYNISQKCATEMIDAFTGAIMKEVKKGNTVQLIGFGSFIPTKRAARNGVNPADGSKLRIPASKAVRFKAGGAFKSLLNPGKKKK